jgi:ribose 5-phosphate isomerase A
MSNDALKLAAAERALQYVEPGMKLGLGTGTTAEKFVQVLGPKVKAGLDVVCVATSKATQAQAEALGIRMTTLDEMPFLDLTVDGADQLDEELRLIKGGGGALLREKIVATASGRMIVIADESKRVQVLGSHPLPLEVVQFGLTATRNMVIALAADAGCEGEITLRKGADGKPFVTDSGNFILDCAFGTIADPEDLDEALKLIPGVVENGMFLGIADLAIVAGAGGISLVGSENGD